MERHGVKEIDSSPEFSWMDRAYKPPQSCPDRVTFINNFFTYSTCSPISVGVAFGYTPNSQEGPEGKPVYFWGSTLEWNCQKSWAPRRRGSAGGARESRRRSRGSRAARKRCLRKAPTSEDRCLDRSRRRPHDMFRYRRAASTFPFVPRPRRKPKDQSKRAGREAWCGSTGPGSRSQGAHRTLPLPATSRTEGV